MLAEIRQDWAQGKTVKLMFQDEARFGRISDVRRCWAPKPLRPVCQGMLTHVNTECMQLFLDEVSARHPKDRIIMVIDGAGWHRSDALKAPENIHLLKLPHYAPELNPIEHVCDELREKFFHNRVFKSLDAQEDRLSMALRSMR